MKQGTFARYEAYKESEVAWLGEVPAHWEVKRVKSYAVVNPTSKIPHTLLDDDLVNFIPMTNVDGELGRIKEFNIVPLKDVASGYTRFRNGDVIFAKITPCMENGNCAVVTGLQNDIGFGSTEFIVFRPGQFLTSVYLHYFLHNGAFRKNAEPFMKGSAGQKRVTTLYMSTHGFPLPPLPEQRAIAAYLDTQTANIDRQIALLTQKAAHYADLKQTLINQIVTRGLDPSVPLKDSGIAWMGEIPAHWIGNRHKDNFILITDRCNDATLDKVGLENIESKTGQFIPTDTTFDGDGTCFKVDDILFGKLRPYLAKVYLAEFSGNAVGDIFVYRPRSNMLPKFAQYLMLSTRYIDVMNGSTIGAKMPRVSSRFIANLPVMTPPLPEQHAIAAYLDAQTAQIDRIIAALATKIEKLQELRKTLVNDVVTGKVRVGRS
ncbi:MAG: restriction endonuclease subunit S [Anaerolineae bacterium]|nr:restriction endonuclease subunit S [Anaerolineae bacterium]